jgi:hypothetical protein
MGKLEEGWADLDLSRRLVDEDGTPELGLYALAFMADGYYLAHDTDRLRAAVRQIEDLSRRLGEPENMVGFTHRVLASLHLLEHRFVAAVDAARVALDIHGRVERPLAADCAVLVAEGLLQGGDLDAACAAAEEAIALSKRSLRAQYEAIGHSIVARALLRRDGAAARDVAEASLAAAAVLIQRSSSKTLVPFLAEWRAELAAVLADNGTREQLLREAQHGYEEIGARGRAARLMKEPVS